MTRVASIELENPFAPLDGQCELVLVRHGEQVQSNDTALGITLDPPLSELGELQASAVALRLAALRVDAIYTSPMRRARDTGVAIGAYHGLTPVALDGLKEFDLWESLDPALRQVDVVTDEQRATILAQFDRTRRIDAFPYAEDRDAFRVRVATTFGDIVDRHLGQRVVVTCHSGVINTLLGLIVGIDKDVSVRFHHTSISVFRGADTRRAVISLNDYSHVHAFQKSVSEHYT